MTADISVSVECDDDDDEEQYNNSGYCCSCVHSEKGKIEPCLSCCNGWSENGFNYWESKNK
jgi:hypothetical protein